MPNPAHHPKLTPAILLIDLPPGILCGIDLLTFTTSARFRGIKNLPPGWHFIYTSETASLSIREGFWFEVPAPTSTSTNSTPKPTSNSTSRLTSNSTSATPTTSTSTSTFAPAPPLIIRIWDPNHSILTPCPPSLYASYSAQLPSLWTEHLTPYRQSAHEAPSSGRGGGNDWGLLTAHITPRLLTHLTGSREKEEWIVSSASCAVQDRDKIPGLGGSGVSEAGGGGGGIEGGEGGGGGGGELGKGEERTLGVLGIDLKRTWRPGAVGRERTEGATDRGWALEDLVSRWEGQQQDDGEEGKSGKSGREDEDEEEQWGKAIMGQMEACFLMVLTVANFSCLEEWKRILSLVLTCKSIVKKRERWFAGFLELLRRQLAHGDDVEGGLFDMSDEGAGYLKELLKGFKRSMEENFHHEDDDDDDDDDDNDDDNETNNNNNNDDSDSHHHDHNHNTHKSQKQKRQNPGGSSSIKAAMTTLERSLNADYGWDLSDSFLRKGLLELEDGEQVEVEMDELLGEDERGEYAPVVVEMD